MKSTGRYIRISPTVFAELRRGPLTVRDLWEEGMVDDDRILNPGKAWQAMDRLLSGANGARPSAQCGLMVGAPLLDGVRGKDSMDTRYLSPEDVAQIDGSLRNVTAEAFHEALGESDGTDDQTDGDWGTTFATLKAFFHEAVVSAHYVLLVQI